MFLIYNVITIPRHISTVNNKIHMFFIFNNSKYINDDKKTDNPY